MLYRYNVYHAHPLRPALRHVNICYVMMMLDEKSRQVAVRYTSDPEGNKIMDTKFCFSPFDSCGEISLKKSISLWHQSRRLAFTKVAYLRFHPLGLMNDDTKIS